jgi:hypothetical protein
MLKLHTEFRFDYEQLNLGFKDFDDRDLASADEYLQENLSEIIKTGNEWIKPKLKIWTTESFEVNDTDLVIEHIQFNCGKKIAKNIRPAKIIALFVATVGNGVSEQYQKYIEESDFLKAYYADALGSISVEKAMDMAQKLFGGEFEEQGLKISNRFSPGYCDWQVNEQHKLFSLLPDKPCGISLSDSALMTPVKSVSGIIAIGEKIRYFKNSCSLCDMKNCAFRKK